MRRPPRSQSGVGECSREGAMPQLFSTPSESEHPQAPYFDTSGTNIQDPAPIFDFSELCNSDYNEPANADHTRLMSTLDSDSVRGSLYQPRSTDIALLLPTQKEGSSIRCIQKYGQTSGLSYRGSERHREDSVSQYHGQRHSSSAPSQSLSPGSTEPYYSRMTAQAAERVSQYEPFGAKFLDPGNASAYRKVATRFDRQPYCFPDEDDTISEIERDRNYHVERIYDAMTRGDAARDNNGSIAMKRWVHGAYYDSILVEAYSHKVLDCLLQQAKEGFRGWLHNDYVSDDRKGEDEDRDVSCAGRLDNVIRALEEEKTICEDVMNSACQIRMFVNAPKAYANRKYQNRVGNSKRGRPRDAGSDAATRPSKMRKSNPRHTTRAQASSSPQNRSGARVPETQTHQRERSRYGTPPLRRNEMTPTITSPPISNHPTGHAVTNSISTTRNLPYGNQVNFMAQSQAQPGQVPQRMTSMPLPQHSPFLSPPSLSADQLSAPATPEDVKVLPGGSEVWPTIQSQSLISPFGYPAEEALFAEDWNWSINDQTAISANLFDQHPDAAQLDLPQQSSASNANHGLQNWQGRQAAQQPPYAHFSRSHIAGKRTQ